jgi:hypothetical protein
LEQTISSYATTNLRGAVVVLTVAELSAGWAAKSIPFFSFTRDEIEVEQFARRELHFNFLGNSPRNAK